jgi:hypothetical protein
VSFTLDIVTIRKVWRRRRLSRYRCEIDFFKHRQDRSLAGWPFSLTQVIFDLIVYGWSIKNLLHRVIVDSFTEKKEEHQTGYET